MPAAMIVYHEPFAASYLLALAPSAAGTTEAELATHLARACQSGKPAVVVDCRLLDTLSATAARLLWACQQHLQRRQARLVLCRVPAAVRLALRQALAGAAASLLIVPTLDDAGALI